MFNLQHLDETYSNVTAVQDAVAGMKQSFCNICNSRRVSLVAEWVLVILYLILFMAIDKHDQSAGVCK